MNYEGDCTDQKRRDAINRVSTIETTGSGARSVKGAHNPMMY